MHRVLNVGNKNEKNGAYLIQHLKNGGAGMRGNKKDKKSKVPKITEEEYAKYISALKNEKIEETKNKE